MDASADISAKGDPAVDSGGGGGGGSVDVQSPYGCPCAIGAGRAPDVFTWLCGLLLATLWLRRRARSRAEATHSR